jgi:nitrile hydratase beta subunit
VERKIGVFTRNGAHDVGGTAGLGPVPVESDEAVWHAPWEGRALGATLAAVTTGMLVPPTHRAVIEALHPVTYLSMNYYELWLYALEQRAVAAGVLIQEEIEARVADTLATPDAPMPRDRNPEILTAVMGLITKGLPPGPEHLAQPPRFTSGDTVRTKRIELEAPGRPHTRIPGYAQGRVGVVEMVHRPMLLEDTLVASGEIRLEYVYAVRLRARDVWPDAGERDTIVIDLWESYLEDDARPTDQYEEQQ